MDEQLSLALEDETCYMCDRPAIRWCDGYKPWAPGDPLWTIEGRQSWNFIRLKKS